ncbi:DUF2493 domain-containing protein [Asticcacaulis sp. YBE204]|uniref:DUF2493 domain-containing protein n=1 Tax=Asticcacaulis sp. YBE204 TaxID=1282363 RepID=UPI0003C3E298|nr:DUF2493 domain-containing protein [Asticcacaulis sp. YBE204]ESQ79259.1 hypothetical protein AEYBE204_09625 [Asticcacaulis sp. YBE204]
MTAFSSSLSRYDAICEAATCELPHPVQSEIEHLGLAISTEVLDTFLNTALQDQLPLIMEGLIGGFHSAALRLQREADRAQNDMRRLQRDFDGSEIKDVELQDATVRFNRAEAAIMIVEVLRDAAGENYTAQTGEVWTPWRGSAKTHVSCFSMIEAKDALKARRVREQGLMDPGGQVVVFRGSPYAKSAMDAHRIYDALNWALSQYPQMRLATSGNHGAEQIAIKWARDKKMPVVLAKADFDRHRRAAPFKANDEMMALDPVLVLTLDHSLDGEVTDAFGPAANIAQKAREMGLRVVSVTRKK